jgi:hypothetical protein
MHAFLLILTLASASCSSSFSANTEDWKEWRAAQEFASSGNFSEAEKALRGAPSDSAAFHYNLGTAAAQQGKWGLAVGHLEKANSLRPHHSSIQHNLRLARKSLAQAGGPAEADADRASSWLETIADQVPMNEVRAVLGMMAILLVLVWTRQYRRTRSLRATFSQPAGLLAALAMAITLTLYGAERMASANPAAIVIDTVAVRSGPGASFTELTKVDAGSKVRVTGPSESAEESWLQVRYGPHEIGWVTASSLLLL